VNAASQLEPATRDAIAELLLTLADDEFVLGFWDSEWTGIAPMLEEDVAFSSLAQDEIGHARAYYELLSQVTGQDPDAIAYGRRPEDYRHCRLLDHPRTDWAFSIVRRFLYDTADAVRLEALGASTYGPLRELVAKIRREETYHLLHGDAWIRRLARGRGESRERLESAVQRLNADAGSVFAPLTNEGMLVSSGVLEAPLAQLHGRWLGRLAPTFRELRLPMPPDAQPDPDGRTNHSEHFAWLWNEFTSVARLEPEAVW
jgi:ring-1,2-phenylacetyl-CoA epoxidase subunit PaaC